MDDTRRSKHEGGDATLGRLLLLLLVLADFQAALPTDADNQTSEPDYDGYLEVEIVGPDYVTVGVPSSIECGSNCPACTYSMSLEGQSARGQSNVLAFTVSAWAPALTVTCTATDDQRGRNATSIKHVQVLAGPANVSISGPEVMNPKVSHTYSCHANCRPSCTYAWMTDRGPWIRGQGNVASITPGEMDDSKVLFCKATNSVSGLFATAARNLTVTSGPSEVHIKGPDRIEIAEMAKFVCSAKCFPSCRFVMSLDSQTVRGSEVEVMVEHPVSSINVKCEVQNTVTRKTATASKTVRVKGSDHNLSARPVETPGVILLASIISAAFML